MLLLGSAVAARDGRYAFASLPIGEVIVITTATTITTIDDSHESHDHAHHHDHHQSLSATFDESSKTCGAKLPVTKTGYGATCTVRVSWNNIFIRIARPFVLA